MNKLLTILVVLLLPMSVFGQQTKQKQPLPLAKFNDNVKLPLSSKERAQITEVYGEHAEKYVFSKPFQLKSMKQLLRNRVVIKQITDENERKVCPKLSEIPLFTSFVSDLKRDTEFNPNTFNPLKYNFEFHSINASMYQVDGTNYYIIIKSQYQ
ncbi:hypothetical protein [uncultured Winogradskyella sp.]|uniref:hypothetical protein n=1 Tax=uncultured Winogradskyella sp. TaxID=395353 RepID=UPI0026371AFF|nr:hypothetical protein [uncultured Winogradskyella sp.]